MNLVTTVVRNVEINQNRMLSASCLLQDLEETYSGTDTYSDLCNRLVNLVTVYIGIHKNSYYLVLSDIYLLSESQIKHESKHVTIYPEDRCYLLTKPEVIKFLLLHKRDVERKGE